MNTENKTSYCTLCREPQTETPDGFQCRNGHLGAGSIPAVYGNDDEIADWGNLTGHPAQVYELAAAGDCALMWTCFHCGESFTERGDAELHFGKNELCSSACRIDIAEYRQMEARMRSYNQDDSDMHRQLYAQESRHLLALRREEESGYAKGLAAATAQPVQPTPNHLTSLLETTQGTKS